MTHKASYDFPYDTWWDVSEPIAHVGDAAATRLRCVKEWKAADPHTEEVHRKLYDAWVIANDRDISKDHSSTVVFPEGVFEESCLSYKNPDDPPLFLTKAWHIILSLLTFGVLYQHYFYTRTVATDFLCTKLIRRVPRPDDPR